MPTTLSHLHEAYNRGCKNRNSLHSARMLTQDHPNYPTLAQEIEAAESINTILLIQLDHMLRYLGRLSSPTKP